MRRWATAVVYSATKETPFSSRAGRGADHNILWLVDGTAVDETATRNQWCAETHAPSSLRLARNLGVGWAVGLSHIWDLTALV